MTTTALTALPLALALAGGTPAALAPQDDAARAPAAARPRFAPPQRLVSDGTRDHGHSRMYPSPRLLDVDGDGQPELVVGDLPGRVTVSERLEEEGPFTWSSPKPLVTDGRELKFNNW